VLTGWLQKKWGGRIWDGGKQQFCVHPQQMSDEMSVALKPNLRISATVIVTLHAAVKVTLESISLRICV
jgi:hypothetical protein